MASAVQSEYKRCHDNNALVDTRHPQVLSSTEERGGKLATAHLYAFQLPEQELSFAPISVTPQFVDAGAMPPTPKPFLLAFPYSLSLNSFFCNDP